MVKNKNQKTQKFKVRSAWRGYALVIGIFAALGTTYAMAPTWAATPAPAPTNLRSFTGGRDIAVLWDPVSTTSPVKYYRVYRDNRQVATIYPTNDSSYLTAKGTRYIDPDVRGGSTYRYYVKAYLQDGSSSAASTTVSATQPTSSATTPVPSISVNNGGTSDLSTPLANAKSTLLTWYPKIADRLARPAYGVPSTFSIKVDPAYDGVAYTSNNVITVSANYLRSNPKDLGMFVHEATHIIQNYTAYTPGFIGEGVPDWVRENIYTDRLSSKPNGQTSLYTDGYGTSSYFLAWIASTYKAPDLVRSLNIAAHNGSDYTTVFTSATGKTTGQLWTQMSGRTVSSLGAVKGIAGKCLDLSYYNTSNGNTIQLLDCAKNGAQDWLTVAENNPDYPSAVSLRVLGKCMDVQYSGTTAGTPVWIWECNGTSAQQWLPQADGSLVNVNSGMCLQTKGSSTVNGTPLEIATCNGWGAQKWTLPPA